jgi:hypothetical protein
MWSGFDLVQICLLIVYHLSYKSLKSIKGRPNYRFYFEHQTDDENDLEISNFTLALYKLYFDRPACKSGKALVLCDCLT